ncbi:Hypothetical predicted protein [Paramuricea clavata]|uniref:Uncharacterized protein n=1 Tax=Paramuricea clavata TaxID=317549 RepID=A0A6S7I967_PARCT|nr:Hypothetical predicted protein [Paramuricea clavata]
MATSTKTYYFETFKDEKKVVDVLNEFLEVDDLCYYRYLTIPTSSNWGIIDQKWQRTTGILQFQNRMSITSVEKKFANVDIYMNVLINAKKPIILLQMRLHVLAGCYGLRYDADTKSSETAFGFGGKKTTNEIKYMKPYIKALNFYKDYDKPDFSYEYLCGARQICKYKYMLEKKLEK